MRRFLVPLIPALFLAGCMSQPVKPALAPPPSPASAGSEVACTADADCRCLIFNGAEFLPGDTDGVCCDAQDVAKGWCKRENVCMECTYE